MGSQNGACQFTLQRRELEPAVAIARQQELHEPIAEAADPIEEDYRQLLNRYDLDHTPES